MVSAPSHVSKLHEASTLILNKQSCIFDHHGTHFKEMLISTPIKLLENTTAYLGVLDISNPLTHLDYVAMETAVSNSALELIKDKAIKEIEYRFKNDIIDDIINGRYSSIEDIDQRAKTVGWNLNSHHVVILVQLHHLGKNILDDKNLLKRKEAISRILMIINSTAYHYSRSMIVINKSDRFVILFPSQQTQSESIKRFCEELHQNIKTQIYNITTTIGIGTESVSIPDIKKSFHEALDATSFGQMVFGNDAVIQYNELGVYRLLCQYTNIDELKKFIHPSVQILNKYDLDKNNDLIKTLEVYLSHSANAKKTAEELFVHYKTIQYRINRIKEIMGIDFEDKQYKLEIEMSLKILNIIEKKHR
jgi:purine catabolism regulator